MTGWDLPSPYLIALSVDSADIDDYGHVNNAVYVTWCSRAAWDHSAALGLPVSSCVALDRGMAVIRTVISYARAALRGDAIEVATWLLPAESKTRVRRRFHMRRRPDGVTLARAEVEYACIEISTGRPTRWPPEFRERYVALPAVVEAATGLAPL
jgi:acyl-CoA thioester hydrolase